MWLILSLLFVLGMVLLKCLFHVLSPLTEECVLDQDARKRRANKQDYIPITPYLNVSISPPRHPFASLSLFHSPSLSISHPCHVRTKPPEWLCRTRATFFFYERRVSERHCLECSTLIYKSPLSHCLAYSRFPFVLVSRGCLSVVSSFFPGA